MKAVATAPHEFTANIMFNSDGLAPYFAADAAVKEGDGSATGAFETDGERWCARLSYQDSGLVHPGDETPAGTPFEIETVREFRLKVYRDPDEDPVEQQDFTGHVAPRWPGLEGEKADGTRVEIPVPERFGEGVNVRVSGSNIEFSRYQDLLARGFEAVGIAYRYFRDPHPSSNVQDAERYVRIDRTDSGPVHARDGPLASLGHVLENDRTGYRKVVQKDDDGRGENLPGYYHTTTLDAARIREVWPEHRYPKELKHYYAREAARKPRSDPLAHPKLGASYQVSRDDGTVYLADLADLSDELDEAVLSILVDAGLDVAPTRGTGPYVADAYFSAEVRDVEHEVGAIDVARIRQEQESVVVRHLADGLSPVQWEILETLVSDGGTVSPQGIADEHGRHPESVRRALRSMQDLVDRKYGEVGLRSDYVAEMVHDAVSEAREATRRAVATGARAIDAADRMSETMAEWVAFCERYGIDLRNRADALELDLGRLNPHRDPDPGYILSEALSVWRRAGQDPVRLRTAMVRVNDTKGRAFRFL